MQVRHLDLRLTADPSRVVLRPFRLAAEPRSNNPVAVSRLQRIVDAVTSLSPAACEAELEGVNRDFAPRHWQTREVFLERFAHIEAEIGLRRGLTEVQKELIGAYLCHEYSYAAAAIMNPSIVPHHDQSGLLPGAVRFILSLRTVGEGHISSIAFREGIVSGDGTVRLLPEPPFAVAVNGADPIAGLSGDVTVHRREQVSLSGSVLFPFTAAQRNGLEDLRLVRFEDRGEACYYGTYTAYSGAAIASELLVTQDFKTFSLRPISGAASGGKGMALFPRRIEGRYTMIGRQDHENLYFMQSDDLVRWDGGDLLMTPKHSWELVQIGNCGAPIEIDEGWLLLTHGVGAMRQYHIGAALLDKENPRRVIGRLARPLLSPVDRMREGYVPNVVYTCGGLANGRQLFLPYGVADSSVGFCLVDLDELVSEMRAGLSA